MKRIAVGLAAAAAVVGTAVAVEVGYPSPAGRGLAPLGPHVALTEELNAPSLQVLNTAFARIRYDLDAVRDGEAAPRTMLHALPADLAEDMQTERRKRLFLKAVLPLVLYVNEVIAAQQATMEALLERHEAGRGLSRRERVWLAALAAQYRTTPDDTAELRARVRPIPPSLAIAQAAVESGWGTSRFARAGNALFGQWTWSEDAGIAPLERPPGATHLVKAYDRLIESVWDYARNLNTNPAYRSFRAMRANLASDGGNPSGLMLAATMEGYSQRGMAYVGLVRDIIRQNGLTSLDGAALAPPETRLAIR